MTIGDIESINAKITLLNLEIDKHPEEVRFDEAHGKKLVELNYERKRFLDAIKVFTYNLDYPNKATQGQWRWLKA